MEGAGKQLSLSHLTNNSLMSSRRLMLGNFSCRSFFNPLLMPTGTTFRLLQNIGNEQISSGKKSTFHYNCVGTAGVGARTTGGEVALLYLQMKVPWYQAWERSLRTMIRVDPQTDVDVQCVAPQLLIAMAYGNSGSYNPTHLAYKAGKGNQY